MIVHSFHKSFLNAIKNNNRIPKNLYNRITGILPILTASFWDDTDPKIIKNVVAIVTVLTSPGLRPVLFLKNRGKNLIVIPDASPPNKSPRKHRIRILCDVTSFLST